MKLRLFSLSIALFVVAIVNGQGDTASLSFKYNDFELRNDTLFSGSGLTIATGQKFVVGNPVGPGGRYRSIISRNAALVPNIWGRNNGYEHHIDNYVDNKKGKKQVAELKPGQEYTIGKFVKVGKNQFQAYHAVLSSEANEYRCDILLALKLKELLFQ